jgi:hypothetical protein
MWRVAYHPRFLKELDDFPEGVQEEIVAMVNLLRVFGPKLKRPRSDTLNGSAYANMKELRFDAEGGVWRLAYAFDPERQGILLVAGDKSGGSSKQFYKALIRRADERFKEHLEALKARKT